MISTRILRLASALALCSTLGACATNAPYGSQYNQYGQPQQQSFTSCNNGTDMGAATIGAVAGALIGSQIGHGGGRVLGAAVGAGGGALAGNYIGCR